jgi:predicted permease
MLTTAPAPAPAVPDIKPGRARALCAASGALAAALAWTVEVPLLGIHLNFRFGTSHIQLIAISQVIGATVAAALLGWLLLAVLDRRTPHARALWTSMALVGLAASLALPLAAATTAATTTSAVVGLVVMHLTIGAVVIPAMARTASAR